jgi:hypothetical protein
MMTPRELSRMDGGDPIQQLLPELSELDKIRANIKKVIIVQIIDVEFGVKSQGMSNLKTVGNGAAIGRTMEFLLCCTSCSSLSRILGCKSL